MGKKRNASLMPSQAPAKRKRRLNPCLAKIHRSYTVDEVASLFCVHKNTVREWVRRGLQTNDDKRPMLILGRHLGDFLQVQRTKYKQICQPGEIYCVKCRAPKSPAGDMADYKPLTETQGNLIAICSTCETMIYRRVSLLKLEQVCGNLDITMTKALPRINESAVPSVNSDFK